MSRSPDTRTITSSGATRVGMLPYVAAAVGILSMLGVCFVPRMFHSESSALATSGTNVSVPFAPKSTFSASPKSEEIRRSSAFDQALVPVGGTPEDRENRELAKALDIYFKAKLAVGPEARTTIDLTSIETFLADYPDSPWAVSLLTNLGTEYHLRGYFSKAMDAWEKAWMLGRNNQTPEGMAITNQALAELARMNARLGRMEYLDNLMAETRGRQVNGAAAEILLGAREGLASMHNRPQESFKCGPVALDSIVSLTQPSHPYRQMVRDTPSTTDGTSLALVRKLAGQMNLQSVAAHRESMNAIPVPSVVHWKLGHFGALLKEENGRYLLQDPTFGTRQWISQDAINSEASGSFLLTGISEKDLPAGWRALSGDEASQVWGKGLPNGSDGGGTGGSDSSSGGGSGPNNEPEQCPLPGMATWKVHNMLVSLNVQDTPLFYEPPVGPKIEFTVNYAQREANQPVTMNYANLGTRWNIGWIGYLTFSGTDIIAHNGTGGMDTFSNYSGGVTDQDLFSGSRIHRVGPSAPYTYERRYRDGSKDVFALTDGTRYFLTQTIDKMGNTVTRTYDGSYRLTGLTDAVGQTSTFAYTNADTKKITKITDPFGREASFDYDGNGRLIRITDAEGMTSEFTYEGVTDAIDTLITGYGTTSFDYTDDGNNVGRTLTATYPDGSKEKWLAVRDPETEKPEILEVVAASDPASKVPQGMPLLNNYLIWRNTFYWSRQAMKEAPDDFSKAHIFHFLHQNTALPVGRLLESEKPPLENRIWYYYKGQTLPNIMNAGITGNITHAGRVLDDGTTQLLKSDFNSQGNLISREDPVGRRALYFYDASGVDLMSIRQLTSEGQQDITNFTYNAQHLPLTSSDSAGNATVFTYKPTGQIESVTQPGNSRRDFNYDPTTKRLLTITDPNASDPLTPEMTYTYDASGNVETVTDRLGYTLGFEYDNLNRIAAINYPDGSDETFTYTLLDITQHKDRLDRATEYTFNSVRHMTSMTDPLDRTVYYDTCPCGSLTSMIDAMGRETKWSYDVQGRLTAKTFADGSQVQYGYEKATSRIKSRTDARGITTHYGYEKDNRIKLVQYTGGTVPTPSVAFAYDKEFPRLRSMIDSTGTTEIAYMPYGSVGIGGPGEVAWVLNSLAGVYYTYDAKARILTRSLDSATQSSAYDSRDRIESETNTLGTFVFEFNGDTGMRTRINFPNGHKIEYGHHGADKDFQVEDILHTTGADVPISRFVYDYDSMGKLTSWTRAFDGSAATSFTPERDLADQLTSVSITNPAASYAWEYDLAGNRTSQTINGLEKTSEYNALNQLTESPDGTTPERQLEWDGEDRLVAINHTATGNRTEFTYDGFGRRVRITEKTAGVVTKIRQFVWDGLYLSEERNSNRDVVKRYFPNGLEIVDGPQAGYYYYATDRLGSITELTDNTGTLRARYEYDAFGNRTQVAGDVDSDIGFTGYFYHQESGLYLAFKRAYDPALGRWLSRDPIGELDDDNLYAYVGNDPLNHVDPTGLFKLGPLEINPTNPVPIKLDPISLPHSMLEGMAPRLAKLADARGEKMKIQALINTLSAIRDALHAAPCPNWKLIDMLQKQIDKLRKDLTYMQTYITQLEAWAKGSINVEPKHP